MKQTIMRMRRIIDLLMTLTLFFLMGYQLWGEAAHEWVGTVMGVLFLLHQWYNRRWYCTLTQGPWSLVRTFHMLVNLLSVLAMLALLASGVVLSSHVFDFVMLSDFIGTAQRVHLAASHWLYVLLALHIGLHGQLLAGAFKRRAHAPHGAAVAALLRLVGAVFALYGLTAFVARDFLDAMFLRVHFFLGDASESALAFYVDYAAIMVCFALAAYGFVRLVRRLARG